MVGGAIGQMMRSNTPAYQADQIVVASAFGWQEFALLESSMVRLVDPDVALLACWLDFLGMNGLTRPISV